MEHNEWIDRLIAQDSYRTAAGRIGTNGSTITRQLQRGALSPEMVIALCRAYDHPAVEGLVETGYLYPHEVKTPGVNLVLPKATNRQLLEEINRRSDPEARHLFTATDDSDVVDLDEDAAVFEFPGKPATDVSSDSYDPLKHAGYSGPDEDALRGYGKEDDDHIP
ncbi:hypothetical protein [uncultured Corynebacterium sp.]|uniref:hypothetical protein n=1 Tax=uncultured Corynebacterium sp. TaxID=159447 RepID=UPI00259AB490|nr:hypothetical protein [uncultured Corynebacterium sp.]